MQGENARRLGQHADAVRRRDDHLVAADLDREHAPVGQAAPSLVEFGGTATGSGAPASTARARRTRSLISPSFQELHAAGPVASASATVSACSRSSNSTEPPTAAVTDLDRRRVVEVAPRRGVGQQQVMTHERGHGRRHRRRTSPIRLAIGSATRAPATLWSSGRSPCRCRAATRRAAAGPAARPARVSAAACAAASSRWRSTV